MLVEPQPIKLIAIRRRISQTQFARHAGLSRQVVHHVFNSTTRPTDEFVTAAVDYFGLPERKLFRRRAKAKR